MTDASFVDTNVWLYAHWSPEPHKEAIAARLLAELWASGLGRSSHQVLNEYFVNVTRNAVRPLTRAEAWERVVLMMEWHPQPTDDRLLHAARAVELRFKFNWWDCLIVAAAQMQRCSVLITEDLQHGMQLDGLRVHNPFVHGVSETSPAFGTTTAKPRRTRRTRMKA